MTTLFMRKIARLTQKTTFKMIPKRTLSYSLLSRPIIASGSFNSSYGLNRVLFCTDATTSPTSEVRAKHAIDQTRILEHLAMYGLKGTAYKFTQFSHGQSNPTYIIESMFKGEGGGPKKKIVLRKQPPGNLLKGI